MLYRTPEALPLISGSWPHKNTTTVRANKKKHPRRQTQRAFKIAAGSKFQFWFGLWHVGFRLRLGGLKLRPQMNNIMSCYSNRLPPLYKGLTVKHVIWLSYSKQLPHKSSRLTSFFKRSSLVPNIQPSTPTQPDQQPDDESDKPRTRPSRKAPYSMEFAASNCHGPATHWCGVG